MMIYLIPFVLQALLMFFDEFYFHRKRGLPPWEKLGHPLDTLTVFVCYLAMWSLPPTPSHLSLVLALMIFSCLFITKDEFIHTQVCSPWENWIHSVLFVLHPVSFLSAFLLWKDHLFPQILISQTILTAGFMLYQFLYWRYFEKN